MVLVELRKEQEISNIVKIIIFFTAFIFNYVLSIADTRVCGQCSIIIVLTLVLLNSLFLFFINLKLVISSIEQAGA